MAAPAFVANGTYADSNSGNLSPGLPAGLAAGHIMLAPLKQKQVATPGAPSGWARVDAGAADAINQLWWKRATGSESAPTWTRAAGNSGSMRITAYSGALASGTPYEIFTDGSNTNPTASPGSTTGIERRLVFIMLGGDDFDIASVSNDLGSWTIRHGDAGNPSKTTLGTDSMVALADIEQPTAGAVDQIDWANSTGSTLVANFVLALIPAVAVTFVPKIAMYQT